MVFFLDNAMLMQRWSCPAADGMDWGVINQLVPSVHWHQVMTLDHENPWAGHLDITKTLDVGSKGLILAPHFSARFSFNATMLFLLPLSLKILVMGNCFPMSLWTV